MSPVHRPDLRRPASLLPLLATAQVHADVGAAMSAAAGTELVTLAGKVSWAAWSSLWECWRWS